jgi:hypothetical protein
MMVKGQSELCGFPYITVSIYRSPFSPLPSPLPCSDSVVLHYDLIWQCTFSISRSLFIYVCHGSANVPLDWTIHSIDFEEPGSETWLRKAFKSLTVTRSANSGPVDTISCIGTERYECVGCA